MSNAEPRALAKKERGYRIPGSFRSGNLAEARRVLAIPGSDRVPEFFELIRTASSAQMAHLAAELCQTERHAGDESLWALLLARWSQVDRRGMMAFVETQPRGVCSRLPEMAWQAWGAVEPDAAFAEAKGQPVELRNAMLKGVAAADPAKAARLALQLPNGQFALGSIIGQLVRADPGAAQALLPRAVYDGARLPIQRAVVDSLSQSDPDEALAQARKAGRVWDDQQAAALASIARYHPNRAAELVDAMPASRTRALSAVAVARTIAAEDPEQALTWTRSTLTGPVRDSALVEVASVVGGRDPLAGLSLLQEVEWRDVGAFYSLATSTRSENHDHAETQKVAASLLRQLATADPEAAKNYLADQIPEHLRQPIATAAGITP